jgi:diacylglycerol kinase family enzyme
MAWEALRRRGRARTAFAVVTVFLLAATCVVLLNGRVWLELIVAGILFAFATVAARRAFLLRISLPSATPPRRAVMIWNPRSGGGKAADVHLDDEARARGIEPIELRPGDDLQVMVRDAVARGADALAAAGGDGTQALVAGIAAEHGIPFACIPAGTRNHFALDLGVDRTDVVGALDAFVCGGERRVDLAEVNGRVFVNNVSLGLYADAVQRPGYRDAKLRMMLDTLPEFAGPAPSEDNELRFAGPSDAPDGRAIVIQVSNNSYRVGTVLGSGTRPRIDDGLLGIAVLTTPSRGGGTRRLAWRQWTATSFEVAADGPVAAGVDGEALMLDPPLRFTIRPGALRVRIAPHHPAASPSAAQPHGTIDAIRQLLHIARTG